MALVSGAADVLLHTSQGEIHRRVGMLDCGVPFVGPSHSNGDGIARLNANVKVAASGCRMIDATGVQAGGLHGNGLVVGWSPVEDAIINVLGVRCDGKGADERDRKDGKMLHIKS